MLRSLSHSRLFCTRHLISFYLVLLSSFFLVQVSHLEAGGWGRTEEVYTYEDTLWNGVYFDLNGLHLTAYIPNHSGTALQNGEIYIKGQVEEAGYLIYTSYNPGFKPPKSLDAFVKLIQDANPTHRVIPVKSKKNFGSKYAVDLIPNSGETTYWRFLSTHDRVIQMGTIDANSNRRLNFFDSIFIH